VPHVFVESNWLVAYAAPAHHQVPAAAELLERAREGEFTLHLPSVCIGEARQVIVTKCQPRREADALRRFLSFAEQAEKVSKPDAETTRTVLNKYEQHLKADLGQLDAAFRNLAELPFLKIFSLDDEMLNRATQIALEGIAAKPFDHAILAGVLVASSRLWAAGERPISFCEMDGDLQPWDKNGREKPELTAAYDDAHIWVFGDFTLVDPPRRAGFK
jgi:hypothetical protein